MNRPPAYEAGAETLMRRRRRPKAEVVQRLTDAARAQFAARGYAAATTRDIAAAADVSETLLFRHFGSKAGLFDHVVFTPFNTIAQRFLAIGEQPEEHGETARVISDFIGFVEQNRALMMTLAMRGTGELQDEHAFARLTEMRAHYSRCAALISRAYRASAATPALKPDLAARLGFGMVLALTVFQEWLFPDGKPDHSELVGGVDIALRQLFSPGAKRD